MSITTTYFTECIQSYFSNNYITTTDGSKLHTYMLILELCSIRQLSYNIQSLNTVFTAEVLTIRQAFNKLTVPKMNILFL